MWRSSCDAWHLLCEIWHMTTHTWVLFCDFIWMWTVNPVRANHAKLKHMYFILAKTGLKTSLVLCVVIIQPRRHNSTYICWNEAVGIGDRWQVTGDRWQVTGDRWQVTGDRWQVTRTILYKMYFFLLHYLRERKKLMLLLDFFPSPGYYPTRFSLLFVCLTIQCTCF